MNNPSYIALSRTVALERQMQIVANNIANASTTAFKGEQTMFKEFLSEPVELGPMSFVYDVASVRNLEQGPMVPTSNPLDIALQGDGYLQVETPAGLRYLRDGHLRLDAENRLMSSTGHPVLDEDGAEIELPEGVATIEIAKNGDIIADGVAVTRLGIVEFNNQQNLIQTQFGIYKTDEPGRPAENTTVLQGMIEGSNVEAVVELVRMMQVSRAYQSSQNMVDQEHDRLTRAVRELPRAEAG